jgi:hypothetical protein
MNALRRPEVIVLLALVVAGMGWVIFDQSRKWRKDSLSRGHEIEFTKVESIPDGSARRLRIEVTGVNAGDAPLEFHAPTVRLLDASGSVVPEFFQPGVFPPALPPKVKASTTIEFWIAESQAGGLFELEVDGRRWPVPAPK